MHKASRIFSFKLDLRFLIKRPLAEKERSALTQVTDISINALFNISKLFVRVLVNSKTAISFNSDLELVPTFVLFGETIHCVALDTLLLIYFHHLRFLPRTDSKTI